MILFKLYAVYSRLFLLEFRNRCCLKMWLTSVKIRTEWFCSGAMASPLSVEEIIPIKSRQCNWHRGISWAIVTTIRLSRSGHCLFPSEQRHLSGKINPFRKHVDWRIWDTPTTTLEPITRRSLPNSLLDQSQRAPDHPTTGGTVTQRLQ